MAGSSFVPSARAPRDADHATRADSSPTDLLVVSWGELLWDLFPDGPRLGGAAANLAYHAAQLGCRSVLVSRVGADALGRSALELLTLNRVDVTFVQVDPHAPTGTVHVDLSGPEPRYVIGERAAWDHIEYGAALRELVRTADVLCYGTLAQRQPLASEALQSALGDVRADGIRLCDLNLRAPYVDPATLLGSIGSADVVKLNQAEAAYLARYSAGIDPAAWLMHQGVELVALTRGAAGALLTSAAGSWEHAGVPAALGGDSVGAGDAFCAALASHLACGTKPATALDHACRLGAYVASRPGGMPPLPDWLLREVSPVLTGKRDP